MIDRTKIRVSLLMLFGLALTALFSWHVLQGPLGGIPVLHALERQAYDLRIKLSLEEGLDPRIIIIDIDEQSLRKVGQWPWSRAKVAQLVDQLFTQYEVDTLGFDVVFAEPETSFETEAIKQALLDMNNSDEPQSLEHALNNYQGDHQLAKALQGRSTVLGYIFEHSDKVASVGSLPNMLTADQAILSETRAPTAGRFSGNLSVLQQAARDGGFFSLGSVTDNDGIIRRVALLNKFQDKLYTALPLSMAQQFLGMPAQPLLSHTLVENDYTTLEALDMGISQIPLDAQAAIFVPYRHPDNAYRYIPAWQVLEGTVDNGDDLSGTIGIIGASASGLVDLRNTPLQNAFPGVEVHANILSGILDGNFRSQPKWTSIIDLVIMALFGSVLSIFLPRISIAKATLLAGLSFSSLVTINLYFWFKLQWIVPIAGAAVLICLLYLIYTILGFFAESRSRTIMRRMFGLYIPPQIVDEMSETPDVYSLKSEKREMSVLFSDVRGFTTISEALTPEDLSTLLNTLLTPITEIIHRHKGAIDKYMGDAVMAFWGAPMATPTHASAAIGAALEMIEKLDVINEDFSDRSWPEMRMGIGISTGEMSVGNMGSEFRMAYTVLGDSVNLGSRLEGLTKMYGVDLIVSENTMLSAPEYIYQELDLVRVKGKQRPEKIFCPLGLGTENTSETELNQYKNALALFREQQWTLAEKEFNDLNSANNCVLYSLYLARITQMSAEPHIDNWDGVITLQHK